MKFDNLYVLYIHLDASYEQNLIFQGQWGTYRHLLLGDLDTVKAKHAYVNTITIGDLSSLRWLEGPLRPNHVFKNPDEILINVSYFFITTQIYYI